MNEIVITGSTGVLGRRVVRKLVAAGHQVTGVTRSEHGRRLLNEIGARAVVADVFDQTSLAEAFRGARTVVNLLTRIPPAHEMGTPGAWDENDRLRRDASAVVARAAGAARADRLIQESLGFVYADGGDAWLDEDAPVAASGTVATALVAESQAEDLFPGVTVVLRFGLFLGPDSHLTLADIERARAGVSPNIGPREAYRPTVWLDDAAAAVVKALDVPGGTYNVADEHPPTRAEIDEALAAAVGRDALRAALMNVPPLLEPVARSQRMSSLKLREASGWAPRVRAGTEGWRLIIEGLERRAA